MSRLKLQTGQVFSVPIDSDRMGIGQIVGTYGAHAYYFASFDAVEYVDDNAAVVQVESPLVARCQSAPVDLAAVCHSEHEDDQTVVLDCVHHPVVADARSPTALFTAAEQLDARGPGVEGE